MVKALPSSSYSGPADVEQPGVGGQLPLGGEGELQRLLLGQDQGVL